MAFITTENVKAAMGITHSDDDERIAAAITRATGVMEATLGRKFEPVERSEVHSGGGPILVRAIPITEGPVVVDLWQTGEPQLTVKVEAGAGVIWHNRFGQPFVDGPSRYRVTYTGGLDTLPADLKAALIECAASFVAMPDGIATIKDGDYQASRGGLDPMLGIPASAAAIFARYRVPS